MVFTVPDASTSPSTFDHEAVVSLRAQIQGEALLPGDQGFDDATRAWAAVIRHTPVIVVMPETAHDVSRAVAFAHRFDLPVAVQGTGHGCPVPCVGGMLINTARMQRVNIYPGRRVARVEAGVKWERVIPRAAEFGLAPLSGSSSDVGVVGYTLGGGHGWLARKYGRAAERIVGADVVTATGKILYVSADSYPDLFWAIRGGSGNFGIVTALEFELVPVETVFGGAVMYPLVDAPHVFDAFARWTRTVSDDITASITVLRLPPLPTLPPPMQGLQAVVIRACAVGDLRAAEAALAPMRELGTPIMDTFAVMPYTAIDAISMDPKESMPARATSMTLTDLDEPTIATLLQQVGMDATSPFLSVEIRDYRQSGTRAVTRGAGSIDNLTLFAIGVPVNPEAGIALEEAVSRLQEAMRPHAGERVALNLLGDGDVGPERTRAAFTAEDYLVLRDIKRRYDPQNRFCYNHNIDPAAG